MVKATRGRVRPRMDQAYQSLPTPVTKPKPPGQGEVETPTNPYRNPCSRCETHWSFWIGLPTVTTFRIWVHHHYVMLLPNITSRGVKYTHDIKHTVLHSNRGPTGLCVIPPASTQEAIVHTPSKGHIVPRRRPLHPGHGGRSGPPHPAFASIPAYDPIIVIKASYFGKKILRMAGIVQMLHALNTPNDNYSYAHPKRIRTV